jgi:hypothetical protein
MSDERAGDCDGGHTEWGADPLKCWRADRRIRELSREVDTLRAQALATVPLADVLAWLDLPEGSSVLDAKEEARRLVNFVARVEDELDCGPVFKVVDRPPPARPPDGGDREPAAPTTNPSTISSKLVDGDTPPAVGDGCVDPCDDPRCTVHPPADVAPRPPAARGGEGEDDEDGDLPMCQLCGDCHPGEPCAADSDTVLRLNSYQRDNLLALLLVLNETRLPVNTGDWFGELAWMLSPQGFSTDPATLRANVPHDEWCARVREWATTPPPAPAGLTDGEVERLAGIGLKAADDWHETRPFAAGPESRYHRSLAFASAVATAVVGGGANPHGWCERCQAHTHADAAVSWICRQCGCEAYAVPQRTPPTPAPGGQEGGGSPQCSHYTCSKPATHWHSQGTALGTWFGCEVHRSVESFPLSGPGSVRPPPARPPDGGDREPAAPTTNPSTISSKLVDGDTPPAVGDGCVDPCDDPRCTVHPPADVAPRPQAARGGEGEDEVRHLDEHNQELLKASDRLHWEIADLRAALSAARTFAEAKALGEVARVLDIYRAGVKAAQLEALDNGHAEQVERLGQRILAVTNIRAALAAHFSSHWPAGGDKD